jgi:hypothetical protein
LRDFKAVGKYKLVGKLEGKLEELEQITNKT